MTDNTSWEWVDDTRLMAAALETHLAAQSLIDSLDPDTLNPEQFIAWCSCKDAVAKARGEAA